ncbi:Wzz/FepE/Etk N-terminal domain-containing protein [Knoellia sp. CPCC 206450]|uniref:Wzz/FepE/Etk N-terminal domain-containing protein n=1 Tax=Knoellia tibetensis TaxID=3404798 RepID=UPI003B42878A
MSEQSVDLRSTWAVLRRRAVVLVLAAVLGAGGGVALLTLRPPAFTSTSVVLLPTVSQAGSGRLGGYDSATQALIVTSSEVLDRAAEQLSPRPSVAEAADRITVDTPASAVLRITASGPTGKGAEELAAAVASSLVDYLEETRGSLRAAQQAQLQGRLDTLLKSLDSVNAQIRGATTRIATNGTTTAAGLADAAALADLTAVKASTLLDVEALRKQLAGDDGSDSSSPAAASVIQPASKGEREGYATDVLLNVLGGATALTLLAAAVVVMTNKRDPKLRSRDELADSVGIPVVASVRARPPRSAGAWLDLLRGYDPDSTDGWALRRLLHSLVADVEADRGAHGPVVVVVLSFGDDAGGLTVGPQIAAFAASTGLAAELVAMQEHRSATHLWAACSHTPRHDEAPLPLAVSTAQGRPGAHAAVLSDEEGDPEQVALSVRVVVLDRDRPEPDPAVVDGHVALFAVSSAAATRRNLADAVVAVDRLGLDVVGLVVANPDPFDRTTGRLVTVQARGPLARPTWITPRGGARTTRSDAATPRGDTAAPGGGAATSSTSAARRRDRRRSQP